ncbi:MAG: reverse transcriptase domain-containing protein [Roseiflexaceae bacterium]|nr:reverse transcriptase domain-containing protein [Roseiflexaceae bacterium]
MPKTFRNLWPQLVSFENLLAAYRAARRGKRGSSQVARFELRCEEHLLRLQDELQSGRYRPGAYHTFVVYEPKRRVISAAPFRDRVVHHALCQVIEPIWEARFHGRSYACRRGRGTHRALDVAQHYIRGHRYVLRCDVEQFFPSIDHEVLKCQLARHIADTRVLDLIDRILAGGAHLLRDEYRMVYFPGDDLFAPLRPRGLPIGNLTSQFWANVVLHDLDMFVAHELRCNAYVRYCDDFLLFADDATTLLRWRAAIIECLAGLRLTLHETRAQVAATAAGVPFLGWTVFPFRRRLRKRNVLHFRRRWRKLCAGYAAGATTFARLSASAKGWAAHAANGNTTGLRRSLFGQIVPPRISMSHS